MSSRVQLGANSSKIAKEETRVPQESVIAFILFLVAMEGFLVKLPKGIFIHVYVDDESRGFEEENTSSRKPGGKMGRLRDAS